MSKFCMGCMEQYEDERNICPHCGYIEGTAAEQALHMEPGSILHERYIVGAALGFGGFGVTYIAWDALLEQKVAIKEYLPSEFSTRMPGVTQITVYTGDKSKQFYDGLDRFVDEARRLAKLQDVDGIVHIYDCFEENNTAYIIMEYLEGETLAQLLKKEKKYSPDEAISMLIPVIDSLAKVHEHGIIHRDLAPDNIFVTKDGTMKVIDFGAARYATTSHSRSLTVIIKPGYSPEEQYRSKSDQGSHTDVYALAATLYKMITGKTPPDALERRAFFENKKKDILKPLSAYCTTIDNNHENAILNAMNVRIEDRTPTMAAFKEELTSTVPVKRIVGKIRKIDLLRWPLWAKIAIPITACLIVTFGVLFGTGVIKFESTLQDDIVLPDGMTRVPSVVNDTLESANERLSEAVLLYMISGKEYSDDIPADYILTQDISAGSVVVQNSTLNIVVSGGDGQIVDKDFMADLSYMTEEKAKEILDYQGIIYKFAYEASETVAKGLIISQDVPAGKRIQPGDVVNIIISTGRPTFNMPNVAGKDENNAKSDLIANGLSVSVEYEYSDTVASGVVIKQNIIANTEVEKGTSVVLTVSKGKDSVVSISVGVTSKKEYHVGDNITEDDIVLTAVYDSGKQENIISGFTFTPHTLTKQGEQIVTVTYSGKTTNYFVNVNEITLVKVGIQTLPNKTSYKVGETLNTTGLSLTITYSDGTTKIINSGITCSPMTLKTVGKQIITITYSGKSTTFNVNVDNAIDLTKIDLTITPTTLVTHTGTFSDHIYITSEMFNSEFPGNILVSSGDESILWAWFDSYSYGDKSYRVGIQGKNVGKTQVTISDEKTNTVLGVIDVIICELDVEFDTDDNKTTCVMNISNLPEFDRTKVQWKVSDIETDRCSIEYYIDDVGNLIITDNGDSNQGYHWDFAIECTYEYLGCTLTYKGHKSFSSNYH